MLPFIAGAQTYPFPDFFNNDIKALSFPDKPIEGPPDRDAPEMGIYKPAGPGPFPAVVVSHTCGGVQSHVGDWTTALVKAGYVVMVMDSFTQRGIRNSCQGRGGVRPSDGAVDSFRALEHLAAQPYVAKQRIGMVGFSWGAMVGLLAARKEMAQLMKKDLRYRAIVSLYPHCFLPEAPTPRGKAPVEFLGPDTDRSLLVLMGGQDEETPPKFCLPRLEALKAKGAPVDWHVYPNTTHGWDMRGSDGYNAPTFFGITHTYRYSSETSEDSRKRALEFFGRELK